VLKPLSSSTVVVMGHGQVANPPTFVDRAYASLKKGQ
jgi:hypothetical protein